MDKKNHTEPAKTGFDAISGAARALYPGQEGVYYGTLIPYTLGGGDPLDGVEIWKSERGVPHWHYITYGFTELYEKESGDPDESGYGFELTFRLKRAARLAGQLASEFGALCVLQRQYLWSWPSYQLQRTNRPGNGYAAYSARLLHGSGAWGA